MALMKFTPPLELLSLTARTSMARVSFSVYVLASLKKRKTTWRAEIDAKAHNVADFFLFETSAL